MKLVRLLFLFGFVVALSACGKTDLTCDDPSPYELAVHGKRVQAPADLDSLDARREMPLPDASPMQKRPKGSPCLDLPPTVVPGT